MASDRGRLSDEKLRLQLARRSSTPLLGTPRDDLLAAITRQAAATPQQATTLGRLRPALRPRLLPAFAGVAAVIVLLALALQLPRGAEAPPGGDGQPRVFSAQELADLVTSGAKGIVLADVSSASLLGAGCGRPTYRAVCWTYELRDTSPPVRFEAQLEADSAEEPTLTRVSAMWLAQPTRRFVGVAYLGPVQTPGEGVTWTVENLLGDLPEGDQLLVIDAWLVASPAHSCRAPTADFYLDETTASEDRREYWLAEQSLTYWCPGEWLTDEPFQPARYDSSGNLESVQKPDGHFLQVQNGAYVSFVDDKALVEDVQAQPSRGRYLVRSAGCPEAVWGECPVWEMVGRLDPVALASPAPSPTISPAAATTASPDPSAGPSIVLRADTIAALAYDPAAYGTGAVAEARFSIKEPEGYLRLDNVEPEVVVTNVEAAEGGTGAYAFRIWHREVELIGRARLTSDGRPWSVPDAGDAAEHAETFDLYAVDGWLVDSGSSNFPCPMLDPPQPCMPVAWITESAYQPLSVSEDDDGISYSSRAPVDGLPVYAGRYRTYAPDPRFDEHGVSEPRRAVYLVRSIECPLLTEACPAWEVVGRLDPSLAEVRAGLDYAPEEPTSGKLMTLLGTWYGYRVRLCNESPEAAFTYVAGDAGLILADGTRVGATNGRGNPFGPHEDVPPGWRDDEQWLDKATLEVGDCAEGWLIFGTTAQSAPERIHWHGRVLELSPPVPILLGPDGPVAIGSETVYYGVDVPTHAEWPANDSPFLMGGVIYFSPQATHALCPPGEPPSGSPLLRVCSPEPGWAITSGSTTHIPLVLPHDPGWDPPAEGEALRVVLRVHVNDPRTAECPAQYRQQCAAGCQLLVQLTATCCSMGDTSRASTASNSERM